MATALLSTQDLTIGYAAPRRSPVMVARDLNLMLHSGELVCLLGPNGAGKSTLMRTLAGMQKPLAGRVMLMGDEVAHLPALELARRLSIVLTERPYLGLMTGYELVALGRQPHTGWPGRLSPHDEAVIQQSVEAVSAGDMAAKPVEELSDGQRQKLMIARALAQEPVVMLLDEPTAFLDLPRRVEIMRLLKHLTRASDRAILLSIHDLDLALRTADCIWLMAADGTLRIGAPEDLVLNGAFEAVFHAEGIHFDKQSGAFKIQPENRRSIAVCGEGIAHTWTLRALEREGFAIAPEASLLVEVNDTDWTLHYSGGTSEYHSIYDLMQQLRSVV